MVTSNKKTENVNYLSIVLGIYVISIGLGLPLVVKNQYFDILIVKYYYYCICTILMAILVVGYSVTVGAKQTVLFFRRFSLKNFLRNCTVADYAVLIYLMVAIISTITSDYLYESFWGNEGRYTGLFLITWYVISYFCVSRLWKYKRWYIDVILAAGMFVCLFGITDYFKLDILHFKINMVAEQIPIFTSTIGNINTYTAYVGILVAVATVLFATDRNFKSMLWHYICMVIGFFAIIMGVSDNAYLSLGVLFGFLPLYLFKSTKGIQRYVIVIATFFSVIQCIDWINFYFKDIVLGTDGLFDVIAESGILPYLVLGLWGLIILWYRLEHTKKMKSKEYVNLFRYIWLILLLLAMILVLYIIYDCNVLDNEGHYGSLGNYFLFNDEWGTHRGYIWRNAMVCFTGFPLWKKLVGFGPETFGVLLMHQTKGNIYNEIFDSAHNEYLQYLLTIGIAGLISYVAFILACIKNCFRHKVENSFMIALSFGIICYSAQAFVNLNLPIVTPIFWLLLGMGSTKSIEEI